MEKGWKNLQALARAAHKKAVTTGRAHQRGNEEYHEGDSGIGGSDEDAEMEVGDGSNTSTTSNLASLQSFRPASLPTEQYPLPHLPLYQPPASAIRRDSASVRLHDDAMFGGMPFEGEQHSLTSEEQGHRGVSIRSMLSHP